MDTQLDRHCSEVLHSKSVKDLLRKMVEFSQDRGFGRVSATVLTEHSPTLKEHQYIYQRADRVHARVRGIWRRRTSILSPSMPKAHSTTASGLGSIDLRRLRRQVGLWERQAPYGYRQAASSLGSIHLAAGTSCSGRTAISLHARHRPCIRQVVEDFHLFAAHAAGRGVRVEHALRSAVTRAVGTDAERTRGTPLDHGRHDQLGDRTKDGSVRMGRDLAPSAGDAEVGVWEQVRSGVEGDPVGVDRMRLGDESHDTYIKFERQHPGEAGYRDQAMPWLGSRCYCRPERVPIVNSHVDDDPQADRQVNRNGEHLRTRGS